jgi:hypothetical protein
MSRYPTLLTAARAAGLKAVRRSHLETVRVCPRQAKFEIEEGFSFSSEYAALGTAFHKYIEDGAPAWAETDSEYWYDLLFPLLESQKDAVRLASRLMMGTGKMGASLGEIARASEDSFLSKGWNIAARELNIKAYPFTFTLDLLLERDGEYCIADYKTGGMWYPIVTGEAPKTYSAVGVGQDPQLSFYAEFAKVAFGIEVNYHAIVAPVNALPYKKKAGDRGEIFFIERAQRPMNIIDDFCKTLEAAIVYDWPRYYPRQWGKPACPSCRFNPQCLSNGQDFPDV